MSFFAIMQHVPRNRLMLVPGLLALSFCFGFDAFAHNDAEGDKGHIQENSGVLFSPFVYSEVKRVV